MAEIICKLSQQQLAVPHLSGSEPLELLLEIGIEKATKDYEYIFTESKICSGKDLTAPPKIKVSESDNLKVRKTLISAMAPQTTTTTTTRALNRPTMISRNTCVQSEPQLNVVGFQNSSFCRDVAEQRIDRLAQIHLLMEHLLLIHIHLKWNDSMSHDCLFLPFIKKIILYV